MFLSLRCPSRFFVSLFYLKRRLFRGLCIPIAAFLSHFLSEGYHTDSHAPGRRKHALQRLLVIGVNRNYVHISATSSFTASIWYSMGFTSQSTKV